MSLILHIFQWFNTINSLYFYEKSLAIFNLLITLKLNYMKKYSFKMQIKSTISVQNDNLTIKFKIQYKNSKYKFKIFSWTNQNLYC